VTGAVAGATCVGAFEVAAIATLEKNIHAAAATIRIVSSENTPLSRACRMRHAGTLFRNRAA
jgi:hypothetical protein